MPASPVVAVFGATSDIAVAVSRCYADKGWRLVLVARDDRALAEAARDLRARGASDVAVYEANFADTAMLTAVAVAAWGRFGRVDVALIAYGSLPDQAEAEMNALITEAALVLNFVSPVMLCNELARRFAAQGSGVLAVLSSVAGDRGRQSNFIYGAAKGGLQRYLQGLRHRLDGADVTVLDVRPGLVATKMTAHMGRTGRLWSDADHVATDILKAVEARRLVLYTPWFWRWIMAGVRMLPT